MKLSGWGRYPLHEATVFAPTSQAGLVARIKAGQAIARGNGRAYGDSAISPTNTVHMRHFNRLISFDQSTGQLVAEAGVLLGDIITSFLPMGHFPFVTPGTKYVTLGGAIAADVHGKNHHKDGSMGNFVDWIELIDHEGVLRRCSQKENPDLFAWTIGGMGLTGVIMRAAIRLRPVASAWIKQTTQVARNLDHAIDLFEQADDVTYSVAWIDCLSKGAQMGRSLLMLGEHATLDDLTHEQRKTPLSVPQKRKKTIPVDFPGWSLNRWSVSAFNALYFWNGKRKKTAALVDWDSYFYPLDAILGWNKIYGRKGFAQFQCVFPLNTSRDGLYALLDAISKAGTGSFLAVLKRFGPQDSPFSFPMEGYTLALDFPANPATLRLMEKLDQITLAHGGRFYLAKDSRMSAETFKASDPRAADYHKMRTDQNWRASFQSSQAERLEL